MDTKNKVFVVIGSIALIATTTIGGYTLFATKDDTTTFSGSSSLSAASTQNLTQTTASSTATVSDSTSSAASSSYNDGTYTASMSYSVPHGAQNSISATVVISGGKITSVKTTDNYSDRKSAIYISDFESGVNSDASDQSLAGYTPSRIGGASLTTNAFASVLDTIRSQATA